MFCLIRGVTRACLKSGGTTPSRIDRLITAVIGTIRSSIHCLRRRVGNGSRSHEAFVDFRMIVRTSLVVVGAN